MELYRVRTEDMDGEDRVILVPDSRTPEGGRRVPMSRRVFRLFERSNLSIPSSFAASGTFDARSAESASLGEIREFVTPV